MNIPLHAGALAFQTILVIIPLLILVFWYLRTIGFTKTWAEKLKSILLVHLNVGSGQQFEKFFDQVIGSISSVSWGWLSLIIFILTALSFLYRLGNSIDTIILNHEKDDLRWLLSLKFLGKRVLIFLAAPLFLISSSALNSWITQKSWFAFIFKLETFGPWFAKPLVWSLDILAFYLIYKFMPRSPIKTKSAIKTSVGVALCLGLGQQLIKLYGSYAITTQKIYGAATSFVLVLLWIEMAYIIFLSGLLFLEKKNSIPTQ
ncbi:MAG: YhjD/YihY/BrkB family envelope integrity protein [Bacteriovoracaceae bacterium]